MEDQEITPQIDSDPQAELEATPEAEDISVPETDTESVEGSPPSDSEPESERTTDWKKRYQDSSRGAQALIREKEQLQREKEYLSQQVQLAQLQGQMAAVRQPQQMAPQPGPQFSAEVLDPADVKALSTALLAEDSATTNQVLGKAFGRANQMQMAQLGAVAQRQQAFQQIGAAITQTLPEINTDPLVAQNFQLKAYQLMQQGFDPLIATMQAANQLAAERRGSVQTAKAAVRKTIENGEAPKSNGTGNAMPGNDKKSKSFNPQVHLTKFEREGIDARRRKDPTYTYDRFFKTLRPEMQAARLKEGKPITLSQLRGMGRE